MLTLLSQILDTAQASSGTMEISAVGALVVAIITALMGAGGHKLLARKTTIEGQPISVKWEQKFATREDLTRLETKQAKDISNVYDRLNKLSPSVASVESKLDGVKEKVDLLIELLKPHFKKP